jgi:preprotein translocase subunit SecA
LRAKGIDDEAPPLTYTGPSEDGSAQVQRSGGGGGRHAAPAGGGGTRRERREAARKQAKSTKGRRG